MLNKLVQDWLDRDVTTITKAEVKERYLTFESKPAIANSCFRLLRTLYNFAIAQYEDEQENSYIRTNPIESLSRPVKLWFPSRARKRHVPLKKLSTWWHQVLMLENTTVRDYLILTVLTGFRHEESSGLKWSQIDLLDQVITLEDGETKNGEGLNMPIGPFLTALLTDRKRFSHSPFVFPSTDSETGHMVAPYKVIDIVEAKTGIPFSPHDLRRTFNLIAKNCGIDEPTRKKLLNHKFQDVTNKHYTPIEADDLRPAMEAIERHALRLAELLEIAS